MKSVTFLIFICMAAINNVCHASENLGSYFYKELGCIEESTDNLTQYICPELPTQNGSCIFKKDVLNKGDMVNDKYLEGSCHASCQCSFDGRIACAHYDCFETLKSGCSHFKYNLDSCCPVGSVCGPIAMCEIEGKYYVEGNIVFLREKCEVCACDVDFELKAPFCRPRKCYDQAAFPDEVAENGAPVFFKDEQCCPSYWVFDEGQEIIEMNDENSSVDGVSCKFGERKVSLGFGFKTEVMPYGRNVPLVCECSTPPLVICKEQI